MVNIQSDEGSKSHSSDEPRRVVIVAAAPVRPIDIFGPAEAFAEANRFLGNSQPYDVTLISASESTCIDSFTGITINATRTFRSETEAIDTLLIAGGEGATKKKYGTEFLTWLRETAARSRRFGSVCTGSFLLADAGLLDDRKATTHWYWADRFAKEFPKVKVDSSPIYVRDGRCYTSAGVTAGIDLSLALIEQDHGKSVALRVAQMMVVFLKRPGGQDQFSATLSVQSSERQVITELVGWLPDHLTADLQVGSLARRAAMSTRNFSRAFRAEVGITPARHIENLRVEAARHQLATSTNNLDLIASNCGFGSLESMRRVFHRRLGSSPGRFRMNLREELPAQLKQE